MSMTTSAAAAPPHVVPFSIRLLRRLKPLVVAMLSSPLHGLLSRDVLLLRYRGRRSGRPYELPLSYVEAGGSIHLCTRPEGSDWWRNLRGGAAVEATVRGRVVSLTAEVLGADSPEALEGLRAFVARNPRTGELLSKVAATPAGPSPADLAREAKNSIVVRLS